MQKFSTTSPKTKIVSKSLKVSASKYTIIRAKSSHNADTFLLKSFIKL